MTVLNFDLTHRQEVEMREMLEVFGFERIPFKFGYDILALKPNHEGKIRVGRTEEKGWEKGCWLKIYDQNLPDRTRKKLDSVLKRCGFKGLQSES